MKKLPRSNKYRIKNIHGYTLIEILVGLTIIGLLFGVGYANFRSFSQRQIVLNAAKNIQGDLRLTQEIALAGQKPSDPNCNAPANTLSGYNFRVLSSNSYEIRAVCSGGVAASATKTVTLDTAATIASPFPVPNPIVFKVLGRGTNIPEGESAAIVIVQTGTTTTSTINVSSGGQIQ